MLPQYTPPTEKRCPRCGEVKPLSDFNFSDSRSGKLQSRCAVCLNSWLREYRKTDRSRVQRREYRSKKARHQRDEHIVRTYGMSRDDYLRLLRHQNGVCAICEQPETSKGKLGNLRELAIDHDHKTGYVRGLLCTKCNQALGGFRDSPDILREAIAYLLRTSADSE